jgi:hypothetical protein
MNKGVQYFKPVASEVWNVPLLGGMYFLGKIYSKIELFIFLKMSDIDCLISYVTSTNTTLAASGIALGYRLDDRGV